MSGIHKYVSLLGGDEVDNLKEKVAYLQGLAQGVQLGDSKEARVLSEVINTLQVMAEAIDNLQLNQAEVEEYLVSMDEDLADLETDVYDDEDDDADAEFLEMTCPNCSEELYFDQLLLDDDEVTELVCPSCGQVIYEDDDWYEEEEGISPPETEEND